jgi:hypothetical protein
MAAYSATAARHAPENCDGTCRANVADQLGDPAVRRILHRQGLAGPLRCGGNPAGRALSALLILAALPGLAAAGARALAGLLRAWLTQDLRRARRAALDGLRLADGWRGHISPVPAEVLMRCCVGVPGPPAGTQRIASRPEALLTSP